MKKLHFLIFLTLISTTSFAVDMKIQESHRAIAKYIASNKPIQEVIDAQSLGTIARCGAVGTVMSVEAIRTSNVEMNDNAIIFIEAYKRTLFRLSSRNIPNDALDSLYKIAMDQRMFEKESVINECMSFGNKMSRTVR